MSISPERIAEVALKRVTSARAAADQVSVYSTSSEHLAQIKSDLDIAAELLALIVPSRPQVITRGKGEDPNWVPSAPA